jgi:multicomponent Na+:H+ antiporter subunit F
MKEILLQTMQYILTAFAIVSALKIVFSKTSSEKLIALMILSSVTLALLALIGVRSGDVFILDVALVYDIFGFLGLLAIARFLPYLKEKKGDDNHDS